MAGLGVCIVGTGWGRFLGTAIRRALPDVRLFVFGRDPAKTARMSRALGAVAAFTSLENALDDPRVEAVVLAIPHHLHRWATVASLRSGKHVFVEKPIATSLDDADVMIESARAAGKALFISDNLHCQPAVTEVRARLESGELGRPLYFLANSFGVHQPQGWRTRAHEMGGGILIDAGVRPIRALRLLFGEPEYVLAVRGPQVDAAMDGEDNVQLLLYGEAGWRAHVLLSWSARRGNLPEYVVMAEKATMHISMSENSLDSYPVDPPPIARLISKLRPHWLQDVLSHPRFERKRVRLAAADRTGHLGQIREFLTAAAAGVAPVDSALEARRDLEIITHAYQSMRSGAPVRLESHQLAAV